MKNQGKPTVVLLAYGPMGLYAYRSLITQCEVSTIVLPPQTDLIHAEDEIQLLAHKNKTQIHRSNSNQEIETIIRAAQPDALVICSYNKILPPSLLSFTKCINVHHGDLPRWRGRANLNWAIILGRSNIGITIHEAIPELDAGTIYEQYFIPVSRTETIKTLYDKINSLVEKKLADVVLKVLGGYQGKPQKGSSTYCCTRLPEDGYITWSNTSLEIDRLIRALTLPYPGAFTFYKGKKMIIWDAEIPRHPRIYEGRIPGRIALLHPQGVEVLTGDSSLLIKTVTYEGKKGGASEFINTVKTSLGINFVSLYERFMKNTQEHYEN